MSGKFDESLLASPVDDDDRSRKGMVAAVAGVLVVVVVAAALWVLRPDSEQVAGQATPAEESTENQEATTRVTTTVAAVDLVPFVTDPAILTVPTTLPDGMRICEDEPIVLCDPANPSRTIVITYQPEMLRDTSSAGVDGIRRMPGEDLALAIAFPNSGLIYTAEGLRSGQLLSIVTSVPLASNDGLHIPDEPPLTEPLTREFVAEIVGVPQDDVEPRGAGYWGINTRDVTFAYGGLGEPWQRVQDLIEMRATVASAANPVSVSADRTLIVRSLPGNEQHVANWIQRDTQWWIRMNKTREDETEVTHDEFLHRVLAIEKAIAELP